MRPPHLLFVIIFSFAIKFISDGVVPLLRHLGIPREMETRRISMVSCPRLTSAFLYGDIYLPVSITDAEAYRLRMQQCPSQPYGRIGLPFPAQTVESHRRYFPIRYRYSLHKILDFQFKDMLSISA